MVRDSSHPEPVGAMTAKRAAPKKDTLETYRAKRDPRKTPEPVPDSVQNLVGNLEHMQRQVDFRYGKANEIAIKAEKFEKRRGERRGTVAQVQ